MRAAQEAPKRFLLLTPHIELRSPKRSHRNLEGFSSLLKFLVRLRRDGTLNDDDFSELVKIASAAFVEAEISEKVENILEKHKLDDLLLGLWK